MALSDLPASGLGQIENGKGYLDSLATKYVVRPKTAKGIAGFVFDYEGETRLRQEATSTDHFAEDNSSIQDHIAIRPVRLTLRGFVSELAVTPTNGILGALNVIQSKLNVLPAYLGKYTPQALNVVNGALTQAQSVVNQVNQGLARAKNIVGLLADPLGRKPPGKTKQELAYAQLSALGFPDPNASVSGSGPINNTPHIFVVSTPYKVFDNMMLETLDMVQDEATKFWSDVTVTLKQMRFAETSSIPNLLSNFSGRAGQQIQPQTDKGKTPGTPAQASLLYQGVHAAF